MMFYIQAVYLDAASVEAFFGAGAVAITSTVYPNSPYDRIGIRVEEEEGGLVMDGIVQAMGSAWN